jgi:poly-gamma-glutamate synthesis protein (capsule biosynthesis protein)
MLMQKRYLRFIALLLTVLFIFSACTPNSTETSTAIEPSPTPSLEATEKITAAGDFMLHGPLNRAAQTGEATYDYIKFAEEMEGYANGDLNITDIEGPVDAFGDNKNIASYPMFNYPHELLDLIGYLGFGTIVTANNHAFDKGWSGLLNMKSVLTDAGFDHIGTYETQEEYDTYKIYELNGIKVGVSAWSALDNGMSAAVGEHVDYAMRQFSQDSTNDVAEMLEDADALREEGAEVVVMALHWGNEYQNEPSTTQRAIAQELIDGGVDIIIGDHPHCVQPIRTVETTRDGEPFTALCIYSLGNFFADQIGLDPPVPKTQYGMLVSITINRSPEGKISLGDMSYMPTFVARDTLRPHGGYSTYGYLFAPAGKYAKMESQPEGISAATWATAKSAWAHVTEIVGDDIEAYDGD